MRSIRANLKDEDPNLLSGRHAVLLVSVGQSIHYGDNLKAELSLLREYQKIYHQQGKEGIKSITITAADVLQRHNFWYFACEEKQEDGHKIKPLSDQALTEILADISAKNEAELAKALAAGFYQAAQEAGQEYIRYILELLDNDYRLNLRIRQIPFAMTTWEDWRRHEEYPSKFQDLKKHYGSSETFVYESSKPATTVKQAFVETSEQIFKTAGYKTKIEEAKRRITRLAPAFKDLDFNLVAQHASLNYLLEECPIISRLWQERLNAVIIYPHKPTKAFQITAATANVNLNWAQLNLSSVRPDDNNAPRIVALVEPTKHSYAKSMPTTPVVSSGTKPSGFSAALRTSRSENIVSSLKKAPLPAVVPVEEEKNNVSPLAFRSVATSPKEQKDEKQFFLRSKPTPIPTKTSSRTSDKAQETAASLTHSPLSDDLLEQVMQQFQNQMLEIPLTQRAKFATLFKKELFSGIQDKLRQVLCSTPPPPNSRSFKAQ